MIQNPTTTVRRGRYFAIVLFLVFTIFHAVITLCVGSIGLAPEPPPAWLDRLMWAIAPIVLIVVTSFDDTFIEKWIWLAFLINAACYALAYTLILCAGARAVRRAIHNREREGD